MVFNVWLDATFLPMLFNPSSFVFSLAPATHGFQTPLLHCSLHRGVLAKCCGNKSHRMLRDAAGMRELQNSISNTTRHIRMEKCLGSLFCTSVLSVVLM